MCPGAGPRGTRPAGPRYTPGPELLGALGWTWSQFIGDVALVGQEAPPAALPSPVVSTFYSDSPQRTFTFFQGDIHQKYQIKLAQIRLKG